ncbi:energy-coupling factor transporter transmembrane component T [Actinomyces culturomici]|uniref:energy-coupling factor transporter transmembrane component T n=1 Tax=Actinomyces culturomici TaxID=1926276 RepID=UPI000E202667|nr:energy-coupling factor transporter transmembrane component T [Actinomyces culturomici]
MSGPFIPPPPPQRDGLAGVLRLDPLAPMAAVIAPLAAIATSHTWEVGALVMFATIPLLIVIQPRRGSASALGLLIFTTALTLGFASTTDIGHDRTALLHHLPYFSVTQWDGALNFTARVGGILALLLSAGLLSDPEDTVRALVVHLKMPNRIGQAGIAALGFPRALRREQRHIIEAHLLRGASLDLPVLGRITRWLRSTPALVAAAVRHAERISMSMDARAFGAHATRTERTEFSWRKRDTAVLLVSLAATALLVHAFWYAGFSIQHDLA